MEIQNTEASWGQNLGQIFDKFSLSTHIIKSEQKRKLKFSGMMKNMHIWPHEENHCLEIPSTEAILGQNIGDILHELFCPGIS